MSSVDLLVKQHQTSAVISDESNLAEYTNYAKAVDLQKLEFIAAVLKHPLDGGARIMCLDVGRGSTSLTLPFTSLEPPLVDSTKNRTQPASPGACAIVCD